MGIQPIWVSSIQHLSIYHAIVSGTPLWRKMLGWYPIPKGFPKVRFGFASTPIVLFSYGEIVIEESSLQYYPLHPKMKYSQRYSNLKQDLIFEIKYSDIQVVERYQHKNAFINYFNINWVRIIPKTDILNRDVLICVGGYGPSMSEITYNTDRLFEIIRQKVQLADTTNK